MVPHLRACMQAGHPARCLPGSGELGRGSVSGALVSVMSGALEGSLEHQARTLLGLLLPARHACRSCMLAPVLHVSFRQHNPQLVRVCAF